MTKPTIKAIASFVDTHCRGNAHIVVAWASTEFSGRDDLLAVTKAFPAYIFIFYHGDRARFVQNGVEIQRCGSGSLALAHARGITRRTKVHNNFTETIVGRDRDGYYYETTPLSYLPGDKKAWSGIINCNIKHCTYVGSKSDYCLLELKNQESVAHCRINVSRLNLISARSLIVTARSEMPKVDYVLRYFNPRYGAYEDPATGSANAMLAPYWQKQLRKKRVVVRQLSESGGAFIVEARGNRQRVIGQTREISLHAQQQTIENALAKVFTPA